MAPFQYRHDDPAASMENNEAEWDDESYDSWFPKHELGQATAPYARFDYNWQSAEWDVEDARLEVGYKLIAFHGRMTKYTDDTGDELELNQYYGVLRYGGYRPDFIPGTFEFSAGLGMAEHAGDVEKTQSAAVTIPLKYYPTDWFGVEFRPAWYRWHEVSINDYDLSASLGWRVVQLRGGYRWFWDHGVVKEQSGPYAGISISF